jgi:hypothetical protein
MLLETIGVVKAASALKCAAVGLANAFPVIVAHSAQATQQMVTVTTPVVVQGATLASNAAVQGATIASQVVANGAQATQNIVTALSPLAQQSAAAVPVALTALGAGIAKGAAAVKAGFVHVWYA